MERLPRSTKEFKGTYNPENDKNQVKAGEALNYVPLPPEAFSEGAKSHWKTFADNLVEMGSLTRADLPALALLCETLETVAELEAAIRKDGYTIATGTGSRKAHPALKSLETTRNAAIRLMGEFGLTPKSRKYVEKAPAPRGASGFVSLRGGDNQFKPLTKDWRDKPSGEFLNSRGEYDPQLNPDDDFEL